MDKLHKNFRTFLLPGVVLFTAYWLVAPLLDRGQVYAIVNALAFVIAIAIVIAYLPEVWVTIRLPRRAVSGGHLLVLGIVVAWASSAERGAYSYLYRYMGEPAWMRDTLVQAFAVWVLVWGGVMHVTAKGAVHGTIPRRNWVRLGFAVAGAVLIVLAGLWLLDPLDQTESAPLQPLATVAEISSPVASRRRAAFEPPTRSHFRPPADFALADAALPAW